MARRTVAMTGAFSYTGRYIAKELIQRYGPANLRLINIHSRN
jgi:hypothetical protein